MFSKLKALSCVLVLSLLVTIVPTASAAVIGHDQVVGFSEVTPTTTAQIAAKKFQPTLKVTTGCVAFPAVDAAVVWIDNPAATNPQILSISYSQHGNFVNAAPTSSNTNGTHPKIEYKSIWPVNHSLFITSTTGGYQPLIDWEDLTPAARTALNTIDFGSANVPMKDSNFTNNLAKAWYQ